MEINLENCTTASPTQFQERLESLDVIRGFALFGILLVNMPLFQWPDLIASMYMYSYELSEVDQWVRLFLDVFVEAKFFTIFSFLFGLGFYIFMSRAEVKGLRFYRLYTVRLFVLALFGFLHMVFLWYGDILLNYALAGFLLVLFYRRKETTILLWLGILTVLLIGLLSVNILLSPDEVTQEMSTIQSEGKVMVAEAIEIYQSNSYIEWLHYRFHNEVIPILLNLPFAIPTALYMFLIGLYAGKRGIFTNFEVNKHFIKRVWFVTLCISLVISTSIVLLHLKMFDYGHLTDQVIQMLVTISGLTLSLFYISSLLLLLQKSRWKKRLQPFSYVGRMALTNYIAQTIIGVGIFTGLGLFGEVNLVLGIIISLIVFPLQMLCSYLWLQKYRFGPLEWIWRSATYGKIQSMKK